MDKFCIHNSLLDGIDFDELITTVYSNEKIINKETIEKVFNEILNAKIHDARYLLKENMSNILNELK